MPAPRLETALRFLPALIVLAIGVLTPASSLYPDQGDVGLYLEKARSLAGGGVPYRDFAFEYPPLGLLPMVMPYLVWPFGEVTLDAYKNLFAAWEALELAVLGVLLARIAGRTGTASGLWWRLTALTAGACLALTWRYDLYPAVLASAAVWAVLEGRAGAAGFAIGLGVLAKLYPIAIVPALAAGWLSRADRSRVVRLGLSVVVAVAVVMLPLAILAGRDAFAFIGYQVARPLQIESIGGGLTVLAGLVQGRPAEMSFDYSAVNVQGPLPRAILAALPIITAAAFGGLAWIGWRRVRLERSVLGAVLPATIVALATASILVLLVTSKVFSIQYVVWLVPFAALLTGRRFWLAAAVVALTIPIHPLLYGDLVKQDALPILVLNLRNLLVVALTAWVVRDLATREVARPAGLEPTTFRSAT